MTERRWRVPRRHVVLGWWHCSLVLGWNVGWNTLHLRHNITDVFFTSSIFCWTFICQLLRRPSCPMRIWLSDWNYPFWISPGTNDHKHCCHESNNNADRKFEMHSSFVEVTITVILRCDLTYDSAAHCFQWSYAMIFSWLVFWRPSAQFVLRSGFGDTAAIWTAMLGGHWLPGNLGKGSRSHAITSSSIGAWSSHPIMACHQTLTGGYGHWRLFEQIKAPLLIKILDTFPLLSSIIWPYRHIWYSGEYQNQSSLVDIMDTDGMNVPSPSFRHAAPCAPWPWVDIDDGT